jgi:hypothetical protein
VATALLVVNHDSTASVLTVDRNLHAVATLRLPPRGPWFIEGLAVGVAVFSHRSRQMWLITSETAATEYVRPDLTRPAVPIALGGELRLFNGTTLGRALPKVVTELHRHDAPSAPKRTVMRWFVLGLLAVAVTLHVVRRRRIA